MSALQRLRLAGFTASRLYVRGGDLRPLMFRRCWKGTTDVVLVYGEHDAEAYRADTTVNENDPFAIAEQRGLDEEITGSVITVVSAVLAWPRPASWPAAPYEQEVPQS